MNSFDLQTDQSALHIAFVTPLSFHLHLAYYTQNANEMINSPSIENTVEPIDKSAQTDKAFYRTTRALFAVAVIGQLLFVYYIVVFYGGIALSGNYELVNEQLPHGLMEGDGIGNFVLAVHLFLAAIITFGGPLQFIPLIRRKYPVFHRWNGRIYISIAFLISIAGLYMIYTRGAHGGITGLLGNTLNATLIMSFSILAWRTAMQRNFSAHKRWALRAFVMVSGVWFFRIGYGLWILLTGFTAPGTNNDLTGPFDIFLQFGHSLVPLLILEFYFFAKVNPSLGFRKRAAVLFGLLSLLLAAGIVMATLIFWLPAF